MNLYLLIFFFIQYPLSFVTSIGCDLSKATNKILVVNVICDYNFVVKINKKYLFSPNDKLWIPIVVEEFDALIQILEMKIYFKPWTQI